jgi:hypothetical protein
MRPKIVPWFNREDYDAIKALIGDDPDYPTGFDEWAERSEQVIAKLNAQGIAYEKAVINPDEFTTYCRRAGVEHDGVALNGFAVVVDRRNRESGTAGA